MVARLGFPLRPAISYRYFSLPTNHMYQTRSPLCPTQTRTKADASAFPTRQKSSAMATSALFSFRERISLPCTKTCQHTPTIVTCLSADTQHCVSECLQLSKRFVQWAELRASSCLPWRNAPSSLPGSCSCSAIHRKPEDSQVPTLGWNKLEDTRKQEFKKRSLLKPRNFYLFFKLISRWTCHRGKLISSSVLQACLGSRLWFGRNSLIFNVTCNVGFVGLNALILVGKHLSYFAPSFTPWSFYHLLSLWHYDERMLSPVPSNHSEYVFQHCYG